MKRYNIAAVAALAAIALPLQMIAAEETDTPEWKGSIKAEEHLSEARMVELAKIPLEQALRTALEKVPGKPLKAELESEDGYLVYGIEIVTPDGKVKEVILDPADGKVLAVEDEDDDHEKGERAEAHGKGKHHEKADRDDD